MSFVTKEWKDRLVEYAGRRKLTNVSTGAVMTMDVARAEGTVSQAGDAFNAANMNNLEQRIANEFENVDSSLASLGGFTPIIDSTGQITGYKTEAGADTVFPFNGHQCIYGEFEGNKTAKNKIVFGFKPSYFVILRTNSPGTSETKYAINVYNKSWRENKIIIASQDISARTYEAGDSSDGRVYSIDDDGVTINGVGSFYGYIRYFALA